MVGGWEAHGAKRKEHSGKKIYRALPSEIRSAVVNKFHRARMVDGKVSEDLFERRLCLPSGTVMTNSDLDRVIETILRCRKP